MVEAVANVFLETLRDLLVEETKFLLNIRNEVDQVKTDLEMMHALLMKADRERHESPTLKLYVGQLRDLAFKAETMLETYAVEVESKRQRQSLKEKLRRYICIMSECYRVDQIGRDTQDIISRLADLTQKLESELGHASSSHTTHDQQHLLRQTYAHEVEPHFVGMQKDIKNIVSMVKDETRTQRVVKIYGMGGLGKTTLARQIFNHGAVQSYARAWVCITQQFQPKAVLGNIMKQLDSNANIDSMDVNDLVVGIYNFLVQRKCLIVIDDIWENDHWEIIKRAFPMNSYVLLTTRFENIATSQSKPYKLEFLTEDEGWDLFHKIALPQNFGLVETDIRSLEAIGREIVVKCGLLPLSISVIGGILHHKEQDRLAEWKKVNMQMDSYLRHGEGVKEYTSVKQVLDLSYDALPYYLKSCFLYLGCFRKAEDLATERLYRLWMAEGFISHEDKGRDETLRDVAERYLTELVMRCMVQVRTDENHYKSHKFNSCCLHDLMHDLCSSKSEGEKLVKRVDPSTHQNDIPPSIVNSTISRLVITFDENMDLSSMEGLQELSHLRSFMVLKEDEWNLESIRFASTISFDKSQCLRILVLSGCEFERDELPSKVGKLIHLRYLSLMYSVVRELPEFVCCMPYLQTLDLRVRQWGAIRVPNMIWKMKRLRHLLLPYRLEVIGGDKLRLDGLKELETLHGINSQTVRCVDILKLISLVELDIDVDDMDSMASIAHHMSNKGCRLREARLVVSSCDVSSENGKDVLKNLLMSPSLVTLTVKDCKINDGFSEYGQGMSENLLRLELSSCYVRGDLMEKLGKYPMLQELRLRETEIGMEEALIFPSNSFPQLKSLELYNLHCLKRLQVDERALPKLTTLQIGECNNLEKLPDGLRFISTLQRLDIHRMPSEFKERVRGQDYATVSHIPTVDMEESSFEQHPHGQINDSENNGIQMCSLM